MHAHTHVYIYIENDNPTFFFVKRPWPCFFCHYGFDHLEPLVWELLRFFYSFFQQNVETYDFATGRIAMLFWFDPFFGHYG